METHKEYSEDDSLDRNKTAREYGNKPERITSGNSDDNIKNEGSQQLIDKYNINDQAHSDSSLDDFIRTTSNFRHAEDTSLDTNLFENPGGASNAD